MNGQPSYLRTRARVETYFDQTATKVWEQLTSDAPVSGIRATVRKGRDDMRALMQAQLPDDLTGARILDAGCGTGAMAVELADRGADVVAIDISPSLIEIAEKRRPARLKGSIDYRAGDMFDAKLGSFDHALAMDSMIYYDAPSLGAILRDFEPRVRGSLIFTLAPRTPLLMAMWYAGKLFPRSDRSPVMIPHNAPRVAHAARKAGAKGTLSDAGTINSGFYHSTAMVFGGAR
ncbi:Mg-protoporphyrin IX methyltransferase [Litoreibacter ponti]|uniref:Magnesium protoporphyrin IX methyltransferase n=1 Tax=Litoreibacter ponti TaxID=1510457 RepID=A0A2T6BPH0_9RHOB|nr:magnesium protoporphyrin IX methyltransferase [Litoreibacter ponti]PTX57980.1 Mg-protoporphyrin IX methyltransferase [Litoreibacter ponti]